ncbi:DUF445 domain-containing protein [bacterium]|nr:DUF445 domain-containing protein [bacterium]
MNDKRRILRKNKALAGSMMVVAAVLFVIARYHQGAGGWEWVGAFAEAAMIGALADWFAVVALFRHPMGVPIPHTAIIPNKKEAISDSLAEFIRDKFLATEALVGKLRKLNPAEYLTGYLLSRENADGIGRGVGKVISESLDFIDDERVQGLIREALRNRLEKFDVATSAGSLIEMLRKDNRHQAVLDELLGKLADWLALPDSQQKIADALDNWITTEYPLISKFIPNREQFAKGAGEKVVKKVNAFIQAVNADPEHELRNHFDAMVGDFAAKLKSDPALRSGVEALKRNLMGNLPLADYVKNLWNDLETWVKDDLDRSESRIRQYIAGAATGLGKTLSENGGLKESINDHLEAIVRRHADGLRTGFAKHVSGTMRQWDEEDFVREIELSIGSDLQFIRMNGTLVGGMIGVLLHAISLLF